MVIQHYEAYTWTKPQTLNLAGVPDGSEVLGLKILGYGNYIDSSDVTLAFEEGTHGNQVVVTTDFSNSTNGREFAIGAEAGVSTVFTFKAAPDYLTAGEFPGSEVSAVGWLSERGNECMAFLRREDGAVALGLLRSYGQGSADWVYPDAGVWRSESPNDVAIRLDRAASTLELSINGVVIAEADDKNRGGSANVGIFFGRGIGSPVSRAMGAFVLSTIPVAPFDVLLAVPGGDDADNDFQPNTGLTGYTQIDETYADGDASYVEAAEVGSKGFYTLVGSDGEPVDPHPARSILAASHRMVARSTGDTRLLQPCVSDGTTSGAVGDPVMVRQRYADTVTRMDTNPLTGADWGNSDFANLSIGFEIVDEEA